MTTKEVLVKARGLIVKGWCQGVEARDKNGNEVHVNSPEACSWCAVGAIKAAASDYGEYINSLLKVKGVALCITIPSWNDQDNQTKAEILSVFDDTISNC